ncbi:2OG-Fe(II) oxygenase [Nocardia mexicana]|uniref:2-oxoglutarate-Fe(II)-dependent oxygenase superfamily protein n=1 Tax=Nocardia mexicana TaxID=279262 RepID=A0A370GXH9_9NOCA|nr:2OG-Fe(II) oxygenase [Nocardia mexicana]RDI48189.1 2-oxoglutarate-Fe(II)-dependent oxygenase superfamily protein [Nocardia mexicana]
MATEAPLPRWFTDLLAHRRWIRRARPFPHVYVRDVFVAAFYRRLAEEFERVHREQGRFTPVADGYSATGVSLAAVRNGPMEVFLSRAWHDLIERVTGVRASGDVEGSLHHHEPDSPRGWPHHDLTPAWFPAAPPESGEVGLPGGTIDLRTGERPAGTDARELVRAVAVLFYLNNEEWRPGDGGETALFAHAGDPDGAAPGSTVSVPPLNNSMVVFECTPRSWHTFVGANAAARNCVVMWLHRPKDEAARRWGGDRIADW